MQLLPWLLRYADNPLILGQRLGEWCGHGPVLEQDMAITNIALDLLGQARAWLQYAATLSDPVSDEDRLAFLRQPHQYYNVLLVEQPNGDWAHTVLRQYLFDSAHHPILVAMTLSTDAQIAAIAEKSLKEVTYHLRYSSEWVIRLGDGTEESHQRMQTALAALWRFGAELYQADELDREAAQAGLGPDLDELAVAIQAHRERILSQATLTIPEGVWPYTGGKQGTHTEHLGHLLTDMQYMQRTYPNASW